METSLMLKLPISNECTNKIISCTVTMKLSNISFASDLCCVYTSTSLDSRFATSNMNVLVLLFPENSSNTPISWYDRGVLLSMYPSYIAATSVHTANGHGGMLRQGVVILLTIVYTVIIIIH